ncbi:MAG: hypothetical protein LBU26_03280 [Synergistaceae bacterium]|nr:hypothetical protein [Synergistaceae bacterium]
MRGLERRSKVFIFLRRAASSGSGGCDAGAFGLFGAAIAAAMLRKKN